MPIIRELNYSTEPGVYALMVEGSPRVMILPLRDGTYLVNLDPHAGEAAFTAELLPPDTIANAMWLGDVQFKISHQERVSSVPGAVVADRKRIGLKCRSADGRTKMLWFDAIPTAPLKTAPAKRAAMPWKLVRSNPDGSSSTLFEPDLQPDASQTLDSGHNSIH
jgi:hypothetical protein